MRSRCVFQWVSAESARTSPLASDDRVLGAIQFGGESIAIAAGDLPHVLLNKPALGRDPVMLEIWAGSAAADSMRLATRSAGPVNCRHDGALLFGAVSVPVPTNGDDALGDAAYAAYSAMLDCLKAARYPHLLRVWNSIPDINADDAGLERYRRFNLQRFRAYSEARLPTQTGAPAATALGTFGGPLCVHFLAARQAAIAIENPRQVSAYDYPSQYGPRAPNFSRAALWRGASAAEDILFISGTASIVGHETRHRGDPAAQTRETVANLNAVLVQAKKSARLQGTPLRDLALDDLALKAYVRHRTDLPTIRAALADEGLAVDRVLFLQADICRADLLLEIEAAGPAALIQYGAAQHSAALTSASYSGAMP